MKLLKTTLNIKPWAIQRCTITTKGLHKCLKDDLVVFNTRSAHLKQLFLLLFYIIIVVHTSKCIPRHYKYHSYEWFKWYKNTIIPVGTILRTGSRRLQSPSVWLEMVDVLSCLWLIYPQRTSNSQISNQTLTIYESISVSFFISIDKTGLFRTI